MDRSPLLSVVVICWNSLERLRQLLDSVPDALAGIPHELILIDNGSTDGTATSPPSTRKSSTAVSAATVA